VVTRTRQRVSRAQAIQILRKQNPARGMNYAEAAKNNPQEQPTTLPSQPAQTSTTLNKSKCLSNLPHQSSQPSSNPKAREQTEIPFYQSQPPTCSKEFPIPKRSSYRTERSTENDNSENNSEIRKETQEIFNEFNQDSDSDAAFSLEAASQPKDNVHHEKSEKRLRSPSLEKKDQQASKKHQSQKGQKGSQASPKGKNGGKPPRKPRK